MQIKKYNIYNLLEKLIELSGDNYSKFVSLCSDLKSTKCVKRRNDIYDVLVHANDDDCQSNQDCQKIKNIFNNHDNFCELFIVFVVPLISTKFIEFSFNNFLIVQKLSK